MALLTDGIWPFAIGGMQVHSYLLCKYLARHSFNITVFHPEITETDRKKIREIFTPNEHAFIEWVEVPASRHYYFPGHYLYESYVYSKNIFKMMQEKGDFDLIYAKGLTSWYTLCKKKRVSAPIAINIHGYEFLQLKANVREWWTGKLLYLPFRFINKKGDFVLSYGGNITQYIKQLGVASKKILEIPGAVESSWIDKESSSKFFSGIRKLLFVGRFERRKGIKELSQVISDLIGLYEFEFHFAGPVPEIMQINHPRVIYHGLLTSREQIKQLLDSAHVLVCPSYSEGMPNVILEAMSRACPVIATDVGAVNLMVNSETGWLIQPASYESLKKSIISAITIQEKELQEKSNAAFKLIQKNYTWDNVGEETAGLLNGLIQQ